jgi:tungstate transport system substrate-binding protein
MSNKLERRGFLRLATGGVLGASLAACARGNAHANAVAAAPAVATASRVRIASVPTAVEGGLLPVLFAEFEKMTGRKVDLTVATKDVYDHAREGACDLVLSHYGHKQAEQFVTDGLGEWPRTVFSNQSAILGPPDDPAKIRGVDDAVEAFARIARSRAPFVVNDLDGQRYIAEVMWNAAGAPAREGWWIDPGRNRENALDIAVEKRGYVLWGLTPFAHAQKDNARALEPLVFRDPLLQRLMVTIIVKKERIPSADPDAARALQSYLLEPATQAKMRMTSYPGVTTSAWAPAGRNNRYAMLPIPGKG